MQTYSVMKGLQGNYLRNAEQDIAHRKKQRHSILASLAFLLLLLAATSQSSEINTDRHATTTNSLINGPQLLLDHPVPSKRLALPVDIEANIEVNGLIAYAQIKQVFINPHPIVLVGRYQFPLPEDAAIKHLTVKIGDREIIGEIKEKQAAKAIYKKAKARGKKASLVEQQRPNLFTNQIANIPGESAVVVTLQFIMPVSFASGRCTLKLPLAMTTRYHPEQFKKSPAYETTDFIPPIKHAVAKSQASLNVKLNAGVQLKSISSNSHQIKTKALNNHQREYLVTLDKSNVIANKSFILNWQFEDSLRPQVSSFTELVGSEYYTLLNLFPPQQSKITPIARDIIFIIDTSGSMQGDSIAQAKSGLQQAILNLSEIDSFNIIAFDSSTDLLFDSTQMVSRSNIARAQEFISTLAANGGTEMYRPLSKAITMTKSDDQTPHAIRQVIFITDGAVANEFELMKLLNDAQHSFRLFTIGIGAAPNGYFMKKAAQFGRGSYVFIQKIDEVEKKIADLMAKISTPTISNIQLHFDKHQQQVIDVYPKRIPDLYASEPIQIAVKSMLPIDNIHVTGTSATSLWRHQLRIESTQSSPGVSTLWARKKIEDLLDSLVTGADKVQVRKHVIATSIAHQIISPYTSFVAVEKAPITTSLLAKNSLDSQKSTLHNLARAHESLMVAMPQTSLNWLQQLCIGLLLILIAISIERLRKQRYA